MRRLSLILSDLYLPSEVLRDAVTGARPASSRLAASIRRARRPHRRLAFVVERGSRPRRSDTHVRGAGCAQALLPERAVAAMPGSPRRCISKRARSRAARRSRAASPRVPTNATAGAQEFTRAFGPEYALHDAGDRAFLLSGVSATRIASVDPARLLDADIGRALPEPRGRRACAGLAPRSRCGFTVPPFNTARERDASGASRRFGCGEAGSPDRRNAAACLSTAVTAC